VAGGVGILTRMFGTALSGIAGFAGGTALGPVLSPVVQLIRNDVNAAYPYVPPSPGTLAEGVAQGQVDRDQAAAWAAMHGIGEKAFTALVDIANVGPGSGHAFDLWRRGIIDEDGFRRALKRLGLEQEWIDGMIELHDELLSPAELANARQQGFIDQSRQYEEAALQGVTNARAELQFLMAGLPPGVETGLQMLRRGIIDETAFAQLVREGHTKTKYTDELLELERQLLNPATLVRRRLKGYDDPATFESRMAEWGYTATDAEDWWEADGRPAAPGQLWTAAARGIAGPGGTPMDEPQFRQAIRESDIKDKYGSMLWELRFLYPSLFQLARLVTAGAVTAETAVEWATKARYAPEVVAALKLAWSKGSTSGADSHVTKASNQLWTATHKAYVDDWIDDTAATTLLTTIGVDPTAQPAVLALWLAERDLERKSLSPAQIKKAFTAGDWTQAQALERLQELGYSAADALELLNE
jgi:hypothetical protein